LKLMPFLWMQDLGNVKEDAANTSLNMVMNSFFF